MFVAIIIAQLPSNIFQILFKKKKLGEEKKEDKGDQACEQQ
jgi:hypothetical protein